MLVLSRMRDESIVIDGGIRVTVVDVRGDKVRLGIEAPEHVQVHREEVAQAIEYERLQAAKKLAESSAASPTTPATSPLGALTQRRNRV